MAGKVNCELMTYIKIGVIRGNDMRKKEIIPTPKELKEMRLREALRQLEELSDFDDQECEQLDLEFKMKNIFK